MSLVTEKEIKAYYSGNQIAQAYVQDRFINELHGLLHNRQLAAIQRAFDQLRPAYALEIAPGPARLTRDLRPSGKLICVEYNDGMIRQGRQLCTSDRCHWLRGDGFRLPVAAKFDLAYSFRFIRHFKTADRNRLYTELRRTLRPGGVFIMDAVNERISGPLRQANPDEYVVYDVLYRPEVLKAELSSAGFEVESMEPVQKFFRLQSRSQVFLGPRMNWLNRRIIRGLERIPGGEPLEWIVTCRRL